MSRHEPLKTLEQFIGQLKKRKVVRVGFAYLVVSWIVMQVADVAVGVLVLPSWSMILITVLLILGLPISLVLAWAYEITPKGIVRDSEGRTHIASAKLNLNARSSSPNAMLSENPFIAVLPFEDMSIEGDLEYLCEGLAEEIIMTLSSTGSVHVATRMGSFEFGSKSANATEIGRKLGVTAFLEGSIRKNDHRLRIAAQLVDVEQGYQFWSEQYDCRMEDTLGTQTEIAHAVVNSLQLTGTIPESSVSSTCTNHQAYEFYLHGLGYFSRMTETSMKFARQMFQKAIDIDPECGRAWAQLACTYTCEYLQFHASKRNREKALQFSKRALELAPGLAQSHIARGTTHSLFGEYSAADQEFQQAIEINPYSFDAWYLNARCKVHQGETEKAAELFEKAASVRPDDYQSLILLAAQLQKLGDEEASLTALREGLERVRASLDLNPDDNRAWGLGAFALLRLGQDDEADRWMNNCTQFAPPCSASTYNAACFYARKGELEKSLDYLEKSIGAGSINMQWISNDMDLDPLRKLPRFHHILAKVSCEPTVGEESENIPAAKAGELRVEQALERNEQSG